MTVPNPQPQPQPANNETLPRYSASDRPGTRGDRIAFQVWIILFLLVIVFTLMNYLLSRFI